VLAFLVWRPTARVTIGSKVYGGSSEATLRLDEPFRALLSLDRPVATAGRVYMEIRRQGPEGEHVEREYTARVGKGNDELFVALPAVSRAVAGPGSFRVVFLLDGEELGAGALRVTR